MPRTNEGTEGSTFERRCPVCKKPFHSENPRTKYCSADCKKKAANERYYALNADKVSAANNERQKAARAQQARLQAFLDSLPPELHDAFLDSLEVD